MKRILFTGGTGFIGRNMIPELKKKYDVYAPSRRQLNLLDEEMVKETVINGNYDVIIHAAIPNPVFNSDDSNRKICEDSLKVYMNFYRLQKYFGKMIYFGSGAEFDKTNDICNVNECAFDKTLPKDGYGLAKYIMNVLTQSSENIYNLRIFGCYGPTDADFKFITHAIKCCMKKENISIRQNCFFDYMHISDLTKITHLFIEKNSPVYHDYNICTGKKYSLLEIAEFVKTKMKANENIVIQHEGMNKEYTASNQRLLEEIGGYDFLSLSEGIDMQIEFERMKENEA